MRKKPIKVVVDDLMQKNYVYYLTASMGSDFADDFQPDLTPKEMLELGVFGGKYMTDCQKEFPKNWFTKARLNHAKHDPKLNYFQINASQSLGEWQRHDWIYPEDPRGWFQWYCRYFMGRRCPDDARQIKRWKAIKRHWSAVKKNCYTGDLACRRRQRQALLHWAYDARKI